MATDNRTDTNAERDPQTPREATDSVPDPVDSKDLPEKDRGPMGPIGSDLGGSLDDGELAERAGEIGLTEASQPGQGPTDDDMTPETLIREDGARHPFEPGGDTPADRDLETVSAEEIGAGAGLDEAEEARLDPLDGKPWDGDPDDPLRPEPGINEENSEAGRKDRK